MQEQWSAVDNWLISALLPQDEILERVLKNNQQAGLPAIDVSPAQGQFLAMLITISGAQRVLEIGTLGGYSAIWMARALPEGGKIVSLEFDPHHGRIAQQNIDLAGVTGKTEIIIGPALESLPNLAQQPPFDFIFIDADKRNNPAYLDWALRLSRPGTLIFGDNVVRNGTITDAQHPDPHVQGIQAFLQDAGQSGRLTATALQTTGIKGWDGFMLARVNH